MYRSFTINAQFLIKNGGNLFILLIIVEQNNIDKDIKYIKEQLTIENFSVQFVN